MTPGGGLLSAAAFENLFAANGSEGIYVSAMSLVELAYLEDKKRLEKSLVDRIFAVMSPEFGIHSVPIDERLASVVRTVPRELVADPGDRIIVASARMLNLPLVTKDERIRASGLVECIW